MVHAPISIHIQGEPYKMYKPMCGNTSDVRAVFFINNEKHFKIHLDVCPECVAHPDFALRLLGAL